MAGLTINQLPTADLPVRGSDYTLVSRDGILTKNATIGDITAFIAQYDNNGKVTGVKNRDGSIASFYTNVVNPPIGFPFTNYGFNIFRNGDSILTDFNVRSYMPTIVNIWYVDPVNGNDSTAVVNDRTKPLLNLATAVAKAELYPFGICIINLTADFVGRTNKAFNNIKSTQSYAVWVEGSFRYISAKTASSVAPTWIVNSTYSNVYQTTVTAANSDQIVDFSIKDNTSFVNNSGETETIANAPKRYRRMVKVSSLAEVSTTPGSWYHDGTNAYVRSSLDRNLIGDQWMQPLAGSGNLRFSALVNNLSVFASGIDFVGGIPVQASPNTITATSGAINTNVIYTSTTSEVAIGQEITGPGIPVGTTVIDFTLNTSITISNNLTSAASTTTGAYVMYFTNNVLALENCTVQLSNVSQASNGLAWQLPGKVYLKNTWNWNCGRDGFNYHSPQSDAGVTRDTSPYFIEVECGGDFAGETGSGGTSDNCTTSHDRCAGICINGYYLGADDRVVADTDYARRWLLGGIVGQASKTGQESIIAGGGSGCAIWMDSVVALNGSNPKWSASGAGVPILYHYNSGAVVNTSGATGLTINYIG